MNFLVFLFWPLKLYQCEFVGKDCIAPKLRKVKIEGSKTLRGKEWRLHNSVGQWLKANLPRGLMEPLFFALRSFGTLNLCPMEFWSNVTIATSLRNSLAGQNNNKNDQKHILSFLFKVIFVSHCNVRDNQDGHFLRKTYFVGRYL